MPLIFKFTYISHILFTYYGDYTDSCIGIKHKDVVQSIFSEKTVYLKKHLVCKENVVISNKIFLFLIIPVTLLICLLMVNHILAPYANGAVSSGQSTYGDLQMHL